MTGGTATNETDVADIGVAQNLPAGGNYFFGFNNQPEAVVSHQSNPASHCRLRSRCCAISGSTSRGAAFSSRAIPSASTARRSGGADERRADGRAGLSRPRLRAPQCRSGQGIALPRARSVAHHADPHRRRRLGAARHPPAARADRDDRRAADQRGGAGEKC